MSQEQHHYGALIETAQQELDRAHRGAVDMNAGEIRRGLTLAHAALTEAGLSDLAAQTHTALDELDRGALTAMETIVEAVRAALTAAS